MRAFTIARNTFRQALHLPVVYVLVIGSIVLLALIGQMPQFTLVIEDDIKMLKDLAVATASICGMLVALFAAIQTVTTEIENWTIVTVLSKPVRRWELVLGKFLGLTLLLTALFAVLTAVYTLLVWLGIHMSILNYGGIAEDLRQRFWSVAWSTADELWRGMLVVYLQVVVLGAIAVALSVRAPMLITVVVFFVVFVLGHMLHGLFIEEDPMGPASAAAAGVAAQELLPQVQPVGGLPFGGPAFTGGGGDGEGDVVRRVGSVLSAAVPDLESLNFSQEVGAGKLIRPAVMLWGALYAALYSAAAVLMGLILFRNREVI